MSASENVPLDGSTIQPKSLSETLKYLQRPTKRKAASTLHDTVAQGLTTLMSSKRPRRSVIGSASSWEDPCFNLYAKYHRRNQQDIESNGRIRSGIYQEYVDFWRLYSFGLLKISALADLSEAPDALLPGNFEKR